MLTSNHQQKNTVDTYIGNELNCTAQNLRSKRGRLSHQYQTIAQQTTRNAKHNEAFTWLKYVVLYYYIIILYYIILYYMNSNWNGILVSIMIVQSIESSPIN